MVDGSNHSIDYGFNCRYIYSYGNCVRLYFAIISRHNSYGEFNSSSTDHYSRWRNNILFGRFSCSDLLLYDRKYLVYRCDDSIDYSNCFGNLYSNQNSKWLYFSIISRHNGDSESDTISANNYSRWFYNLVFRRIGNIDIVRRFRKYMVNRSNNSIDYGFNCRNLYSYNNFRFVYFTIISGNNGYSEYDTVCSNYYGWRLHNVLFGWISDIDIFSRFG